MQVKVNGEPVRFTADNKTEVAGKMWAFKPSLEIPLPKRKGRATEIQFVYVKDSGDSKFGDAAWIKDIRISGTKPFVHRCVLAGKRTSGFQLESEGCGGGGGATR